MSQPHVPVGLSVSDLAVMPYTFAGVLRLWLMCAYPVVERYKLPLLVGVKPVRLYNSPQAMTGKYHG